MWPFKKRSLEKVRLGIIGMGNIGKHHADCLLAGGVARCELAAVLTSSAEKGVAYAKHGLKIFTTPEELFRSGALTGQNRVLRGGAFVYGPARTRLAFRGRNTPDFRNFYVGGRVVLEN